MSGKKEWSDITLSFSSTFSNCFPVSSPTHAELALESLARMELLLFFTSLLQCFRFTPPPWVSEDELDLAPAVGFSLCPQPQTVLSDTSEAGMAICHFILCVGWKISILVFILHFTKWLCSIANLWNDWLNPWYATQFAVLRFLSALMR